MLRGREERNEEMCIRKESNGCSILNTNKKDTMRNVQECSVLVCFSIKLFEPASYILS